MAHARRWRRRWRDIDNHGVGDDPMLGSLVLTTALPRLDHLRTLHSCMRMSSHEMLVIQWRRWWKSLFRWLWWWWFGHWPHVHGNVPVRLDHRLPDLRQNDFAVRTDKIVVALMDVRADDIDVQESLFDEFLHTL